MARESPISSYKYDSMMLLEPITPLWGGAMQFKLVQANLKVI